MTQNIPVYDLPFLYAYGCPVSYASTTTFGIGVGQVRDSNDNIDLLIEEALVLNTAVNGINGLDTGTFAKAKWYYLYIIGDSSNKNPTGSILSLSATQPLLPFGYDSFRLISIEKSLAGSAAIEIFTNLGNDNQRTKYWDTPIQVLNAGTQNGSFAAVDASLALPPLSLVEFSANVLFVPNAASNFVDFRKTGSSATSGIQVSGVVASETQRANVEMLGALSAGVAKFDYQNSAASCSTTVNVTGFKFYI